MDCEKYYVCAYGPAESFFWKKCSYRDTGEIASNGLKIFEKMRTVEYFKREVLCKEEQEEKAPKSSNYLPPAGASRLLPLAGRGRTLSTPLPAP